MIGLILLAIKLFYYGLIIYCIMSFVRGRNSNKFFDIMDSIYQPILTPISNLLAPFQKNIGLDFSPIILILLLNFITNSLSRLA
ncbi:MAG: YggT family protein [Candidatus Sericytochromatia bacterium]